MAHFNYKHLHYFWMVAAEGSVARAAELLHVTPQTISGQLRLLEESIGARLFEKSGRGLALTDTGQTVLAYAEEMFRLGGELRQVLSGRLPGGTLPLHVGVAMVVPKLLAYRVLQPALGLHSPVRLVCHEAPLEDLLASLAVHKLDMVLSDGPMSPALNVRAYNHFLGDSAVSFFARTADAQRYPDEFPRRLNGEPMLMPSTSSALRRALEQWFERHDLSPVTVAEFEDRALMKAFGEGGAGIFTTPTAVEADVLSKYDVQVIGRAEDLRESLYVISAERRIKHPAVAAITDAARQDIFHA